MDQPEVFLIDDDECVRRDLTLLLHTAGLAARSYDSTLAFLRDCDDLSAGCVLADIRTPDMNGLEFLKMVKERKLPHPVIMISGQAQISRVVEAFQAGAFDYLEKPLDDALVLAAVQTALMADQHARRVTLERGRASAFATLTLREHEVLRGLVRGRSIKAIANDLGISPRTVEVHRAKLMLKSGAQSLPGLVRLAVSLNAGDAGSAGVGESLRLAS